MLQQSKGIIQLAQKRNSSQLGNWHRSYHQLESHRMEDKATKVFETLQGIDDETLNGGCTIGTMMEEDGYVLLIPVVGAIEYATSTGKEGLLEAGEAQMFFAPKSSVLKISNPYDDGLVNYLQIRLAASHSPVCTDIMATAFDLDQQKDQLLSLFPKENFTNFGCYIAKLNGRTELTCKLQHPANGFFALVIEGVFELQYRLLQTRDSLILWDLEEVEIEALSQNAIILLIEVGQL